MNNHHFAREVRGMMVSAYRAGATAMAHDMTDLWFDVCEKLVPPRGNTPGDRVRNAPAKTKSER